MKSVFALTAFSLLVTMSRAQELTNYSCSWVGNSFPGGYTDEKWVQDQLTDMKVFPDGIVAASTPAEEGKKRCGLYKDGAVWLNGNNNSNGTLDGAIGGIACNGNKCFAGRAVAVRATKSDKYVYGIVGSEKTKIGCWKINNDKTDFEYVLGGQAAGLEARDSILVASFQNSIHIIHNQTAARMTTFSVPSPGNVTIDTKGTIWVICNGNEIRNYSRHGDLLATLSENNWHPQDVSIDNTGRLMVADNGPDQQVKFYTRSPQPVLDATLGQRGGISSGAIPGTVTPEKLWDLTACGTDDEGNIYVAMSTNLHNSNKALYPTIRSYSPDGKSLNWEIHGLEFCTVSDYDPKTGDLYSLVSTYSFDYNSPPDGSHWELKAHTIDVNKYPDDARMSTGLGMSVQFSRIEDRRFLYMTGMGARNFHVFRLDGELAVPAASFGTEECLPNAPGKTWMWRDENGNGQYDATEFTDVSDLKRWSWWVDDEGTVWNAYKDILCNYPCEGIDTHGNPIYSLSSRTHYDVPAPFNFLLRAKYDTERDIMILSGYSNLHPKDKLKFASNKGCGLVYARYDTWSKGNRTAEWTGVWEYSAAANSFESQLSPRSFDFAGDYLFVCWVSRGSSGESVLESRGEATVYSVQTGEKVGYMLPDETVGGPPPTPGRPTISGAQDMSHSLRAHKLNNDEYFIIMEENKWAKNLIYRWCPDGKCADQVSAIPPVRKTATRKATVVEIFSLSGKKIGERAIAHGNIRSIETASLFPAGMWLARIRNGNESSTIVKMTGGYYEKSIR